MARNNRPKKEPSEFEHKLLDVARVARVTEGGKRFSFRVTVVIGNRKGKVGVGIDKALNVSSAVEKATANAKKNMIEFPLDSRTIPHEISSKVGSAKVFLMPAVEGRGIIAGGAARAVLELVGIKDVSSKTLGSSNKVNNARATVEALNKLARAMKAPERPAFASSFTKASENKKASADKEEIDEIKETKEIKEAEIL